MAPPARGHGAAASAAARAYALGYGFFNRGTRAMRMAARERFWCGCPRPFLAPWYTRQARDATQGRPAPTHFDFLN